MPGGFSNLLASSPRFEPRRDCPSSWRPWPFQTFFPPKAALKIDRYVQPPNRRASVSAVNSLIVVRKPTPTAYAAPLFHNSSSFESKVPLSPGVISLPVNFGATLGLCAACLYPYHWSTLQGRSAQASLPRRQSASLTPTRAAAGFSWTSPAASKAVAPVALLLIVFLTGG